MGHVQTYTVTTSISRLSLLWLAHEVRLEDLLLIRFTDSDTLILYHNLNTNSAVFSFILFGHTHCHFFARVSKLDWIWYQINQNLLYTKSINKYQLVAHFHFEFEVHWFQIGFHLHQLGWLLQQFMDRAALRVDLKVILVEKTPVK